MSLAVTKVLASEDVIAEADLLRGERMEESPGLTLVGIDEADFAMNDNSPLDPLGIPVYWVSTGIPFEGEGWPLRTSLAMWGERED